MQESAQYCHHRIDIESGQPYIAKSIIMRGDIILVRFQIYTENVNL